jgi:immune inhibitor A
MLKRAILLSLCIGLSLPSSPAWAVRHIKPGAFPNHKQDMVHRPTPKQMKRFGSKRSAIIGASSGSKQVAVIVVRFPVGANPALISGNNNINNLATVTNHFINMRNYYLEVSSGALDLQFSFFGSGSTTPNGDADATTSGSYLMPHSMDYYGCGDEGFGCGANPGPAGRPVPSANGDYLIADALEAAINDTVGPISENMGGAFDAVLVMHAGNGNETTQTTYGDIWSIYYSDDMVIAGANPVNATLALAGFTEGAVFPETEMVIASPLGVMCHEFGHELGLPDLYNTSVLGGASVVGDWELMDSGPYLDSGRNPAHLSAWSKANLGWVTPQLVSSGTVSIGYAETSPADIIKLQAANGLAQEHFLIEYRSRTSGAAFDRFIPGNGLLIWHVDDALATTLGITGDNTVNALVHSAHYGVSVIPNDGQSPATNGGDAGDAYGNGSIFISPKSNNFANQPSGVGVVNISGVGSATATMDVSISSTTDGQHIAKVINFPNPAGKGYPHTRGEGFTTIQFQLSRPAQDYSINIYTLSADLVKKINKDQITLNSNREADFKWVYEYEWNLTNDNGKHVAPGTYLYLIRADGETKSSKMVVIR